MYKHILLPTDGSELSERAEEHEKQSKEDAQRVLDVIKQMARDADVACTAVHRVSERPWEEIINVAAKHGCDVIFMASHGRRGVSALLIGSETNKVLTHSKIPVLVWR